MKMKIKILNKISTGSTEKITDWLKAHLWCLSTSNILWTHTVQNVLDECQDERLRNSSHFLSWYMLSLRPGQQMCPLGSLWRLSLSLPRERMYGHCHWCQIQCLLEHIYERIPTAHCIHFGWNTAQVTGC